MLLMKRIAFVAAVALVSIVGVGLAQQGAATPPADLVLRNGRQAALADTADLTQQALLSLCYGNETAPAQLAMETTMSSNITNCTTRLALSTR